MSTLAVVRRGCVAVFLLVAPRADAQSPFPLPRADIPVAGGEWERYARALQLAGVVGALPWSIRAFGPAQVELLQPRDSIHPWRGRHVLWGADSRAIGIVSPEARTLYNTAFPFGYNDGAVWAGRGATAVVSGGLAARYGALSVTMAPTYFAAQNRAFDLMPTGWPDDGIYNDGLRPGGIDRPQRFGDGTYARLDWGQSTVRLDAAGAAIGFSTANQYWGPAVEHPLLLGNNAAGFAHAFLATSRPVDIWIGRVQGKIVWGRIEESDYSPAPDSMASRLGSGLVATFTPRGVPGLELGAARFFHTPWPAGGLTSAHLRKPLEGILKQQLATDDNPTGDIANDNQLASIFARWVFPRSGVEVYGEYAREDHSWDARDLWMEPDHIAAYLLGIQRVWKQDRRFVVGRAELVNSRMSHLTQVRPQSIMYVHGRVYQGHTSRGEVLGSIAVPGGGAAVIGADLYHPGGRWSASLSRLMRGEYRQSSELGLPAPDRADVMHALAVDGLLFRGGYDITGGITAVQNLNRNFQDDAFNLNLALGVRAAW